MKDYQTVYGSKYKVLDTLGSGNLGMVYKVKNVYSNKLYIYFFCIISIFSFDRNFKNIIIKKTRHETNKY